jgi:hypothetical protein
MKRDNSAQCSVCARWFTTGGRLGRRGASKGLPPLCPAHYHRALRGSPRAKDPGHGYAKRETKADRLARLVKAADVVVTAAQTLAHVEGTAMDPRAEAFAELNAALIAWNVGAR